MAVTCCCHEMQKTLTMELITLFRDFNSNNFLETFRFCFKFFLSNSYLIFFLFQYFLKTSCVFMWIKMRQFHLIHYVMPQNIKKGAVYSLRCLNILSPLMISLWEKICHIQHTMVIYTKKKIQMYFL